jgi:hypothetical protein
MSRSYNGKYVWYDKEKTEELNKFVSKISKRKRTVYDLTERQVSKLSHFISGKVIRVDDSNWRRTAKVTVFCMASHTILDDNLTMEFYDSIGSLFPKEYISIRSMRIVKDFDFLSILNSNDKEVKWRDSIGAFVKHDIDKWWPRFYHNLPPLLNENTGNAEHIIRTCDVLYLNAIKHKDVWFNLIKPYYINSVKLLISPNGNFIQPYHKQYFKLLSFFDGNKLDKWLLKKAIVNAINTEPLVKEWIQKHCPEKFLVDFTIACLQR